MSRGQKNTVKNGRDSSVRHTNRGAKNNWLAGFVVILVVVILMLGVALGWGMYDAFSKPVFCEGVSVNGINVGAMTYDEAQNALRSEKERILFDVKLAVNYDDSKTTFDASELGVTDNADEILKSALMTSAQDKSIGEKYNDVINMTKGQNFDIELVVDETKLHNTLNEYAQKVNVSAKDAQAKYNKTADHFVYADSENGKKVDVEALYKTMIQKINSGDFSDVSVMGTVVAPEITTDKLKENTALIGSCITKTTENENRNINIDLMCKAVDGLKIEQGQTLSINDLVGERTEQKGFKNAPAIMDGTKLVDDMGGGICQLSGTLYNAALKANMEIVERVHHTWPSTYLPIGLDATLNWDDKDLKIKNNSEWPIYISAEHIAGEVVVKLYGQPLPDGLEIEIRTDMIKEIDPPKPDVIYTDDLQDGVRQVQVVARKGYQVKTYRDYFKDDKLVESQLISDDYFHEIQAVILEGSSAKSK